MPGNSRHVFWQGRYLPAAIGALIIAALAIALYVPHLNNALVFDDHGLFTNLSVYDYAQRIFDFRPRTFPYFTLGLIQVETNSIAANRIFSLVLHIACAWMLFALLNALLRQAMSSQTSNSAEKEQAKIKSLVLSFVTATWFAIHPVAVYGAGYLVQRTILFATLFALLSLWFYQRAFAQKRRADVITAALFYSIAVFSKEHAVMLPLAAIALSSLYDGTLREKANSAGLYLLLCLPAAAMAVLAAKSVVGTAYEPYVSEVIPQVQGISLLNQKWGPWFVSALMQMGFLLDYLYYWIFPDVQSMSADMRIDFVHLWHSPWPYIKVALFFGCFIGALYCLRRGGRTALFGCGLIYSGFLFLTELVSVRFQEPFVLYRSYLWAPGFAMMILAVLGWIRWQLFLAGFVLIAPVLFISAQDRLDSLKNERTVWEDAANKLSTPNLPGADRIYYNRGGERFKLGLLSEAMKDLNKVVALNPNAFQGYLGRGMIYLKRGAYSRALIEFNHSLSIKPDFGFALYRRGLALEGLGKHSEALDSYAQAEKQGDALAKLRLTYLKNNFNQDK